MTTFRLILTGIVAVMLFTMLSQFVNAKTNPGDTIKQYHKPIRLAVKKDDDPGRTTALADKVFALTPPLRPERLNRRMKILWGIDLNDYPVDELIILGGALEYNKNKDDMDGSETGTFLFSPQSASFIMQTYPYSTWGYDVPSSFPPEQYALFYRYLMMGEAMCFNNITTTIRRPSMSIGL